MTRRCHCSAPRGNVSGCVTACSSGGLGQGRSWHLPNLLVRSSCCGSAGYDLDIVSMRTWVRSLALLRGLRIWCGCRLQHRSQIWLRRGRCCACGVSWQLRCPWPGNFRMLPVWPAPPPKKLLLRICLGLNSVPQRDAAAPSPSPCDVTLSGNRVFADIGRLRRGL